MKTPPVGSLVVPSPRYRETMGTGEAAAILMSLRRGSGNLYYAVSDQAYWVPLRQVRSIPADAVPEDCLEAVLSELLLFVRAEDCQIHEREGDSMYLTVESPGVSRDHLEELERGLGDRLDDFAIEPASMRALALHFHLIGLPDASSAGT